MTRKNFPTEAEINDLIERLIDLDPDDLAKRLSTDFMTPIEWPARRAQTIANAIATLNEISKGIIIRLALTEQGERIRAQIAADLAKGVEPE